jgi:GNAT superfamily N-acetyltransferase
MMDKIDIRIERASSPASGRLIAALDQDIVGRYPGMAVNGIDVAGFEADGGVFAIGYVDGEPAMCGAFRRYKDAAEIKRMFVVPAFRGCGLGRRMLRFLEDEAARRGFARAILETGKKQVEAIGLYASAGWQPMPPFGPYVDSPISTCFEKRLAGA